ncbi:MAG: hypothetical protein J6M62_10870 [Selenomonadaceae bacterium]|nr:hypothetical protein [Selenomonadaceae bacterium]
MFVARFAASCGKRFAAARPAPHYRPVMEKFLMTIILQIAIIKIKNIKNTKTNQ